MYSKNYYYSSKFLVFTFFSVYDSCLSWLWVKINANKNSNNKHGESKKGMVPKLTFPLTRWGVEDDDDGDVIVMTDL